MRAASVTAISFLVCTSLYCVSPPGYTRKVWLTQDGLPEQTVQAFAQTPDHYLWIGTTGGLLRFDGSRLTVFDNENTPELRENSIFALQVSRDGSLWIGTEGGGLLRYKDGRFHAYGARDGLSDGFVRALLQDRQGTLWVGTDNGLLRMVGDRFQRVDAGNGQPAIAVHAIAEDALGRLWVGGSRLWMLDHGLTREYQLAGPISENRVKSILVASDRTVWVGTVSGLNRLGADDVRFERISDVKGTVRVLRQTSDGTLWIGMIGQGIRTLKQHQSGFMTAADVLPSSTVLNIFEDDEGNIWIGTQTGMVRLTHTPVRIVPLPQSVDSDFGTIQSDRDGTIWIVSANVFRMRDGVIRPYHFAGLEQVSVRDILRDRDGALWIGTDGDGIIRMDGSNMLWLSTKIGLVNNFIRAILQSRDGSMWIATDEGLSHWTPRGFTNYRMRNGLSYFSTRALLEDRNGDIWVGTDRGLNRLHGGVFMEDAAIRALNQKKVWAIHQDANGGLWFGTRNDGLFRWKEEKLTHYTTDQGLASNSIYEILEDTRGGFWISGPNGISLLSRRELDEAADHPTAHLSVSFYGISSEVDAAQIYGGRQPSGCVDNRGGVWFLTNRGPLHILRGAKDDLNAAPVIIQSVMINGRQHPADELVRIQPGNSRLEISYAPILLRSQEDVRFRYRLEGFDGGWIDASTRRVASYTSLPAGKYHFEVEAYEVNHPDVVSRSMLDVVQQPLFYRTPWFIALSILLLAVCAGAVYSFRLWQIKMRFEAVLDERGRLAREMHDTVIQGCTSVSALIEGLSSVRQDGDSMAQSLIEHARSQIRRTIDEAREAVWNLRRNKPAENTLCEIMRQMTDHISGESGVPIRVQLIGRSFVLNQYATHQLMMMAREGIHNAVLHAMPGKIEVALSFSRNHLTLEICDDGSGFDPSQVQDEESRHYGLIGMRERVKSVGGRIHLSSAIGKGTKVRIQMPRKVSVPQNAMQDA